jgi:protein phosphatase
MNVFPERRIVERAERCYRALLVLYPKEFRRRFQQEMVLTFRDTCRATLQQQGSPALLRFLAFIGYELMLTLGIEHYRACLFKLKRLSGNEKEFSMLSPLFQFNVAALTDIGCVRANNEDSMLSVVPEDEHLLQARGALFIVADGMGGHDHGEVASNLVVNALREAYYRDQDSDLGTSLSRSATLANKALLQEIATRGDKTSMGTTCIAAVLHGDVLYVINVGDSRAYVIHQGSIRQISQDHSFVAEEVRKGIITEEEAKAHPKRNIIYRSMGTSAAEIDLFTESVQIGDVLLLCTDGLTALISAQEILETVNHSEPEANVAHLIALAKERGAPDNVTALVVRVGAA